LLYRYLYWSKTKHISFCSFIFPKTKFILPLRIITYQYGYTNASPINVSYRYLPTRFFPTTLYFVLYTLISDGNIISDSGHAVFAVNAVAIILWKHKETACMRHLDSGCFHKSIVKCTCYFFRFAFCHITIFSMGRYL